MNSNGNTARPVRIRIDQVQVNTGGDTGGHDVYKLAAMSDDYALFRKVSGVPADAAPAQAAVQPPA